MKRLIYCICSILLLNNSNLLAQDNTLFNFGQEVQWEDWILNKKNTEKIHWINVNTDPDTWRMEKGNLICKGKPIGVVRSATVRKLHHPCRMEPSIRWR